MIPPRGEVNAADAFDIGNFDDDDTRGIKMAEEDQKIYRKFNLVVSDRWQAELMGERGRGGEREREGEKTSPSVHNTVW